MMAVERIPTEIWVQIALALPVTSLPSFVLTCRKFHRSANCYLYRTVNNYCGRHHSTTGRNTVLAHREPCFGVHRAQSWLFHPDQSSKITNLSAFLRTITENVELMRHVIGASIGWNDTATAQEIIVAKKCLEHLKSSLSVLHIDLPKFDDKFVITSNVTFLEMEYPRFQLIDNYVNHSQFDAFRDNLYRIFCIPTLRHLTIKKVKASEIFARRWPDSNAEARRATSNVISLSLPETVPLSDDLKEILKWPKALRRFYHQIFLGDDKFFRNFGRDEAGTSPQRFIQGLYSQRHAIEELVYNNEEDRRGYDFSTFGKALTEFVHLKRLAVSSECLISDWDNSSLPLYETLPPNLEEAWISLDGPDVYCEEDRPYIIQMLQGIAMHKEERFPSLTTLVVWDCCVCNQYDAPGNADEMLQLLGVHSLFKEAGIDFFFKLDCKYPEMVWIGEEASTRFQLSYAGRT